MGIKAELKEVVTVAFFFLEVRTVITQLVKALHQHIRTHLTSYGWRCLLSMAPGRADCRTASVASSGQAIGRQPVPARRAGRDKPLWVTRMKERFRRQEPWISAGFEWW